MKGPITEEYLLHLGKRKRLQDIKSLDLSNHDLKSLDSGLLNHLTSLEALDLSWNHLEHIPSDLKLNKLRVFDCSNNNLGSVEFVKQFGKLDELYIDDNEDLTIDDDYIVKALCPKLRRLDEKSDLFHFENGIKLFTEQLSPKIDAVWEARYAEVYSQGIDQSEIDRLLQEFVKTFNTTQLEFHKDLPKFRQFMIRKLSSELINGINSKKENKGTRNSSQRDTPNSKYRTRVKLGNTPVKDYSKGVPMDITDVCESETNIKVNDKKRKRESMSDNSPALKRKRTVTPEKSTEKKIRGGNAEKSFLKKREELTTLPLPPVPEYDPVKFIRCHSSDNDPADCDTKVWKCAFEPRIDEKGETSETIATCGGRIVCFVDCHTCKVIRRYKDNSDSESFYCLSWTTLKADGDKLKEDANILAVAGQDGQVKLIYPQQLVKYATLPGHKDYISALIFHPKERNILFSASRDGSIIQWDIGVPDFKDYKTLKWSKLARLHLDKTDAISMVITPKLNMEVRWFEREGQRHVSNSCYSPDYELNHQSGELDSKETVDSLCVLHNKYIVSKCVGSGFLYVWDIENHIEGLNKRGKARIALKPLYQLDYTPVDVDYLYASACKENLLVGDDLGNIHMYNLKQVLQQKQPQKDVLYQASCVIRKPEFDVDPKFERSMKDVHDDQDVVINCVALSSNQNYLVCGMDNNLVCVWKKTRH